MSAWTPDDWIVYENRLLRALDGHVGVENAIGGDALFAVVFHQVPKHRINGTRALRRLVRKLRGEGVPVMSTSSNRNPGYYLARPGTPEFEKCCEELEDRALTGLVQVSKMRRIALPVILGQMQIKFEGAQAGTPAPPASGG